MDSYLFYCPVCQRSYSKKTDNPRELIKCMECRKQIKNTGILKSEWDEKSLLEKEVIKKELQERYNEESSSFENTAFAMDIKAIRKDMHTIALGVIFISVILTIVLVLKLIGII